jgi:hypothetical protein
MPLCQEVIIPNSLLLKTVCGGDSREDEIKYMKLNGKIKNIDLDEREKHQL